MKNRFLIAAVTGLLLSVGVSFSADAQYRDDHRGRSRHVRQDDSRRHFDRHDNGRHRGHDKQAFMRKKRLARASARRHDNHGHHQHNVSRYRRDTRNAYWRR
ncbi:MAG: hypothetical protein EOO04_26540 [Chitinophagaceae bacterium]|nr:MAG: hypothetical protein EOO04_26540 [Chitinophagaceae bacterium]